MILPIVCGSATWKVLNINGNKLNDTSIVVELSYNNTKYLFMGDATTTVESSKTWNNVDVLKVGHHGSASSTSQEFVKQLDPKYAIISTNGRYGHPNDEVLERLLKQGTKIYRTDKNNTIWITSNGNEIKVKELNYSMDGTRKKTINDIKKVFKCFLFFQSLQHDIIHHLVIAIY